MSDFLEEDIQDARGKLQKPLELKIQVIFGQVVGACLNTHPMYLWVTRDGTVIPWNPTMPGLLKKGHGFWEKLPEVIFQLLLRCLREFWPWMRQISEELAKNLDELRVDWLLGDDTWGCRIGEVTYMGTMALDVFPISWRLAKTFAAGHLSRRRAWAGGAFLTTEGSSVTPDMEAWEGVWGIFLLKEFKVLSKSRWAHRISCIVGCSLSHAFLANCQKHVVERKKRDCTKRVAMHAAFRRDWTLKFTSLQVLTSHSLGINLGFLRVIGSIRFKWCLVTQRDVSMSCVLCVGVNAQRGILKRQALKTHGSVCASVTAGASRDVWLSKNNSLCRLGWKSTMVRRKIHEMASFCAGICNVYPL